MDRQTILLISDMRQVYLAEILTKKGHNVRCLDIRNRETALQQLEKLKRFLDKADVLILPIPVQKVPEQEIFYDILNKNLEKKTLVMGGCFSTEQRYGCDGGKCRGDGGGNDRRACGKKSV